MDSLNDLKLSYAIVNSLTDHIVLIDKKGRIIFVNESWISFAMQNDVDLSKWGIGANYFSYYENKHEICEGILSVLSNKAAKFTHEYPYDSPNEKRWFLMNVTPLHVDSEFIGVTISHVSITDQKNREEKLRELATKDTLTSLHNRGHFEKIFIEEIVRANRFHYPISLIMLDIDHFKKINDNYGHLAGDKVLIEVSNTVQRSTRRTDTCARYGGEEFAILMPETDAAGTLLVARKIHKAIQDLQIDIGDETITVTASMGMIIKSSGFEMQQMIDKADKALYSAKNSGRNTICIAQSDD